MLLAGVASKLLPVIVTDVPGLATAGLTAAMEGGNKTPNLATAIALFV